MFVLYTYSRAPRDVPFVRRLLVLLLLLQFMRKVTTSYV